jgi:tRNA 5-methylaminomethyl-2-thiouridine biosynthesis bifunctional protein
VTRFVKHPAGWQLEINGNELSEHFDAVIVCNAAEAKKLLPDSGMWLNPVRGQMGMITAQPSMRMLKTILCGDGYLTPLHDGQHAMGATFAPGDNSTEIRQEDNLGNLDMVSRLSPAFNEAPNAEITFARASLRCGSPDYLPYVGPILPTEVLKIQIAPIEKYADLPSPQGLYVHVAHGSKGLMTAPFCAAMLARRLLKDFGHALPQLSEDSFWNGLHPQRLLFKQLGWQSLMQPFSDKVTA